jgi:PTH1 family peptidyl-tRNA hydrolase
VRMGIGRPEHGSVTDFVLKDFSPEERVTLDDVVKRGADAVHHIATFGVAAAMNEFNRRNA